MIIFLTILMMIIFAWNIYSTIILFSYDEDIANISLKDDGVIKTLAKIYCWILAVVILGGGLLFVCYNVSREIVCNYTNNDYSQCEKENK